jgi:hypothetical protein
MGEYKGTVTGGEMWYLSAIVREGMSRQYWVCVGKVRASDISTVVHPFRRPADTTLANL